MESSAILREWFDRVDSEKIGSVTAIQLKSAFAIGNLEFPISVVQQMIRMYDFDRNGTMSFEEFVELNKFLLKVQHVFSDLESSDLLMARKMRKECLDCQMVFNSPFICNGR